MRDESREAWKSTFLFLLMMVLIIAALMAAVALVVMFVQVFAGEG